MTTIKRKDISDLAMILIAIRRVEKEAGIALEKMERLDTLYGALAIAAKTVIETQQLEEVEDVLAS